MLVLWYFKSLTKIYRLQINCYAPIKAFRSHKAQRLFGFHFGVSFHIDGSLRCGGNKRRDLSDIHQCSTTRRRNFPVGGKFGVTDDLLEISRGNQLYAKLVALGCAWLDSTGTGSFSTLSEADQITVVRWMTTADWNQIPRRFYFLTRQAAVELYYSSTYATNGLPLNDAPQPNGYPPPWT